MPSTLKKDIIIEPKLERHNWT